MNDFLPINPSPLVGGQNWFDNIVNRKYKNPFSWNGKVLKDHGVVNHGPSV